MPYQHLLPQELHQQEVVLALLLLLRPAPAHAGQDAQDKTSPFEALRWNGDVPEVLVQGDWYRPLLIHDVGVEDIIAFLERTQPGRVRKRFGEDLPEMMRKMGRVIPARVVNDRSACGVSPGLS